MRRAGAERVILVEVASESQLVSTERGLVPKGDGWFVLNARETQWWERSGRGVLCEFEGAGLEGATDFAQLGINLTLLGPGEPMAMYHWEADQEDFLVLSGEAILIVEGEERTLRQWTSCIVLRARITRSSARALRRVSCSPSAHATAPRARIGARIPSTEPR